MPQIDQHLLKEFASKYIWWKTVEEAIAYPDRIIAQVMDIGDYEDVQTLSKEVGEKYLRQVLSHAEIGQFNARSWAYWHYRLDLAKPGHVPPMPTRKLS